MTCQLFGKKLSFQILFFIRELYLICIAFFYFSQANCCMAWFSVLGLFSLSILTFDFNILIVRIIYKGNKAIWLLINCINLENMSKIPGLKFCWVKLLTSFLKIKSNI